MSFARSVVGMLVLCLVVMATVSAAGETVEVEVEKKGDETVAVIKLEGVSEGNIARIAELIKRQLQSAEGEKKMSVDVAGTGDGKRSEPKPLDGTATLEFSLAGQSRPVVVQTALSEYSVCAEWSSQVSTSGTSEQERVHDEHVLDVKGIVAVKNGALLVSCSGAFAIESLSFTESEDKPSDKTEPEHEAEEVEERTEVEFFASGVFRPGEAKVIVARGEVVLVLKVNFEPIG